MSATIVVAQPANTSDSSSSAHRSEDIMNHRDRSDVTKIKTEADGSLVRKASTFRKWIEQGGEFSPERGRYHLYASYGCPWATRTLIVRKLKGLEDIIPVTILSPRMGPDGWAFGDVDPFPGADPDPLHGAKYIKDIYLKVDPEYPGRFTVPMLYDKHTQTIVNNESADIIRMFNSSFDCLLSPTTSVADLYPLHLRSEIDDINSWVYETVNNGVYKAGFATAQQPYEDAVVALFASLDRLESVLSGREYIVGDQLTEADVRLFVTMIRFDPAYYVHFKCNLRTIRDGYPSIHLWMRKLYWNIPAFKETCDFEHIRTGYYWSMAMINPHRIVPLGPQPYILPL